MIVELVDGSDEKDELPRGFRTTDDRASRPAFGDLESLMTRVTLNECVQLVVSSRPAFSKCNVRTEFHGHG